MAGTDQMSGADDACIFVSIAAYRDRDLPNTIADAVGKAAGPHRLRFGICHQYDDDTIDGLALWSDDPRVWVDAVPYHEALGAGWARARIQAFYDHEAYYLQIDSHSRFEPGWDQQCIAMLDQTESERPILTNYLRWFTPLARRGEAGGAAGKEPGLRPGRRPVVAAGHLFTLGRFVLDVPYDPDIDDRGEEISLAVRAYTHGYDVYYPHLDLFWHWYQHGGPLHWADDPGFERRQALSVARVQRLLHGDDRGMGRYGLGHRRTLQQYRRRAGVRLPSECGP